MQASFQRVRWCLAVTYGPPGMREARDPINRLRTAIDCLPAETRRAMLDGIRTSPIVVGAYTDNHLAAEGDTDLATAIAEHRAALQRRAAPEITAQRLHPGRLRLGRPGQRDVAARTPSPKRTNVASGIRS